MASSNQAAWLDGAGQKLRVAEAAMPEPGSDEIVVRNHAVAVNPADWKIQDTGMFIRNWPIVLGLDVAGEVHAVGSNVTRFKIGDRVVAHPVNLLTQKPQDGGFQKFTAVPAVTTAALPDAISYPAGAVLPLATDTALVGLIGHDGQGLGLPYPSLNPKPLGKTVVVWGGSSSVGSAAIQLAVAAGARVVAVASAHNLDFCRRCGAVEAYDYKKESIVDDVVEGVKAVGGEFVGVYDAISLEDQSYKYTISILEKLGGGVLSAVLPLPKHLPDNVQALSVVAINHAVCGPVWERYITPALEAGKLQCLPEPLVMGNGLEYVQKGLDENKKGVSARKVVIEL